ncbi:MAG: VPLPA-CTERM sorting domain-containing protein [Pseudomonadota bacterium]
MASTSVPLEFRDNGGDVLTTPFEIELFESSFHGDSYDVFMEIDSTRFKLITLDGLSSYGSLGLLDGFNDFDRTQFPNLTYGGLLPLDSTLTADDVTGVDSFSRLFLDDFARVLNTFGLDENDVFDIRALLPFTVEDSGNDILAYLDLQLEGTAKFRRDNLDGDDTIALDINMITVHGGAGTFVYGGSFSDLTLAGPTAPIPVPASLPLLAAGIGGLAALRHHRRKAA